MSELVDTPDAKTIMVIICSAIYYAVFYLHGDITCISVHTELFDLNVCPKIMYLDFLFFYYVSFDFYD